MRSETEIATEVSKKYWGNIEKYPDVPHNEARRKIDVEVVLYNMKDPNTVLDLGCAGGYLLINLRKKSPNIKKLWSFPVEMLMTWLIRRTLKKGSKCTVTIRTSRHEARRWHIIHRGKKDFWKQLLNF